MTSTRPAGRRKAAVYAAHRRCWKVEPADDVYEEIRLAAEIEADWDVMDLAVARWERMLRGPAHRRS